MITKTNLKNIEVEILHKRKGKVIGRRFLTNKKFAFIRKLWYLIKHLNIKKYGRHNNNRR